MGGEGSEDRGEQGRAEASRMAADARQRWTAMHGNIAAIASLLHATITLHTSVAVQHHLHSSPGCAAIKRPVIQRWVDCVYRSLTLPLLILLHHPPPTKPPHSTNPPSPSLCVSPTTLTRLLSIVSSAPQPSTSYLPTYHCCPSSIASSHCLGLNATVSLHLQSGQPSHPLSSLSPPFLSLSSLPLCHGSVAE